MKNIYTKYKSGNWKIYHFIENENSVYCINKYWYHEDNTEGNKHLKNWFICYKYDRNSKFSFEDYIYSLEYKDYFMEKTLKEVLDYFIY